MQPERTAMSWRRTVLAIAVGALISIRLLPPVLGLGALLIGAAGFVTAVAVWVLAVRRGAVVRRELRSDRPRLPGGGLGLVLALLTSAGSAVGLVYALTP